jgi:microsomal prostaglandin-E synthase 2
MPVKAVTLYQFSLCPFCNKVRSGLELKGISYTATEVNPRNKAELPPLPSEAPRKVPVLDVDGELIWDSTTILQQLDRIFPETRAFRPADPELRQRADDIEAWVDAELIRALPTVLYGTLGEASRAAAVVAKNSKYTRFQGLGVMIGGSVVMHFVAKRLLKQSGRRDGHAWVAENLDQIERWLGEQPYMCGDELTIADVAVHGAFACVEGFPIYESILARPRLRAWLGRMEEQRLQAQRSAARPGGQTRPAAQATSVS